MSKPSTYSGAFRKKWGNNDANNFETGLEDRDESSERLRQIIENNAIDEKYSFPKVTDHNERIGFLINLHACEVIDEDKRFMSAIDYYFLQEDGHCFKVTYPFKPYFYVLTKNEYIREVSQFLTKKFSGTIHKIELVTKEDLDLPNHLIGLKQNFLKLSFLNQTDMQKVKRDLNIIVRKNKSRLKETSAYTKMVANFLSGGKVDTSGNYIDHTENILDIREHDVPYHVRVSIDLKIFCGSWYSVRCLGSGLHPPIIKPKPELIERPEPVVLAFDIETTKPPLKFPDATFDKIMMISYMIDGRGYLITNREILSSDISNFEYTPKPELKGHFKIFNEPNEESLLKKFFEHILKVKPHIFVTYNGDFFDWPFIEARAAYHNINMKAEIGFSKNKEGLYTSRPAIHMDCLCWVKRDSYLPVGSQNLKAVAKAKLRYDPVELDPEEMCPLAASNPQVLANYSVSDAVATYYLYMKYVHPFIFALCTIIPCEPDEVLRKGSGTLCEALLMVEAFHANIIFPNKHETVLNKMTDDGHVLLQETYVGGHVEALESGIFRADIPCRFRICPEAIDNLIEHVPRALKHAIEVEEGVPLDLVTNFEDVKGEINEKLVALKECPMRLERPLIYHLDVGAMYPNIILTNRLQPSAIVDEAACAACDFNKSNAACKRNMAWMWRAEYMPASRGEYQRIQLQLETEKFPPKFPGGPMRAFHQLSRAEQAELEKSRLSVYCRKVYKKNKVTKLEERTTTICQKENSFYVDTVRAFRDRRYEYKGLSKKAKQEVTNAVKSGDAGEIKSAKNKEILYDSLQLAHKCILNSFYGYVMRAGSRWYSMEMGGIVCHTGANIITKAREIIEKIGRPLELDTDGIWCILPASFPENFTVYTNHEKKKKLNISYPNAVLNAMVKEHFTNDQYHELINPETHEYIQKSENSIFFEVDGPYKAMMLPASKEEGKKLKKRYAVFNFDGSLAELKGFEVKRRGELQLIKNFQSSVFESFLKGDSLESCYAAVAQVADYWLDVLYSKGRYMEDSELFDLISENRSMSKKLEEYGSQKSTSISTAKRLAEFLGDQMVKDAGLACKYVISKKPDGAPVTERAIPLAIFQSEEAVKIHFLRRWLKDNTLVDVDIRDILDWNYYIERLGGAIQKIITIPAAMQGVSNPVPRVSHPLWLHKKVLEKGDKFKQRSITDMFSAAPKDIEDFGFQKPTTSASVRVATVTKRKRANNSEEEFTEDQLSKTWRDVLGNPPPFGKTQDERLIWLNFQKKKWRFQAMQRALGQQMMKRAKGSATVLRSLNQATLGGFLQKSQRSLLANPWQIVQIAGTNTPGEFKLWALVQSELHEVKLTVPRIFYTNLRTPKCADEGALFKKCNRILPRQKPIYNLYQWTVPEELFQERKQSLMDQSEPNTEGIYETQVPLLFRALLTLGCLCKVRKGVDNLESFALEELEIVSMSRQNYLADGAMKHLYLYHHKGKSGPRQMFALFLTPLKKAVVFVVDSVRTNLMPNLQNLYEAERIVRLENNPDDNLPPSDFTFEIRVETDVNQVFKLLQKALHAYRDEKKGPTLLSVQTQLDFSFLQSKIPSFGEMPTVPIHVQDIEELYNNLEWQKIGAKALIRHYLNSEKMLTLMLEQCRYFHLPVGNFPADPAVFGADLFYARHLVKHNHVLWCSPLDRPDLGGSQENNARLLAENLEGSSELCNKSGWYSTISVELDVDSLAINTILQVPNIVEAEGTSSTTTFDADVAPTLDDMLRTESAMTNYDETARCAAAFKILRNMTIGWMRDISEHRNVFADFQVIHFYRWLRSPKALLYDPALLKTLQNLMKKLFVMLISRLQELNCNIIYANFDKLVLSSKHTNVKDALDSIEFIVTTIRNKEIFHTLEISYSKCWEQLVWLDSVNYGGIVGKLPEGIESNTLLENVDRPEHPEDDDTPIVMMNWSLAEQLPDIAGCRNSFKAIIAGYVNAIYLKAHQNHNRTQLSLTTKEEQDIAEFAEEILRNDLSQKLFEITEKLYNRLPPKLDGVNVALEFVKIICHILSLYPPVRDTVANIKCSLLKIIGIGEYSDESIFKDNTVSYVISQLICKVCNHCRDVDLGRDPHRSETGWLCPLCTSPYENPDIEWILLDTVNRKIMAFNLQDLQCRLCKEIKFENLMKRCSCGGTFKHLIDRKEFVKLLETFSKIGEKYDMHSLKETVDQILQLT